MHTLNIYYGFASLYAVRSSTLITCRCTKLFCVKLKIKPYGASPLRKCAPDVFGRCIDLTFGSDSVVQTGFE